MKKLNFGCGNDIKPKKEGWVNVDIQKRKGIDKSFDFEKAEYPFKDDTFDHVLMDNVIEHLNNPDKVLRELWRICKKDAKVEIIVPYYNSYYAYADVTHVNFFNELAMAQLIEGNTYSSDSKKIYEIIKLNSVPQRFLKWLPKSTLNILKRFFGNIIVTLKVEARVLK
jgi:ubiquinone/menaquinone biosynthesis C-methylase UbiE